MIAALSLDHPCWVHFLLLPPPLTLGCSVIFHQSEPAEISRCSSVQEEAAVVLINGATGRTDIKYLVASDHSEWFWAPLIPHNAMELPFDSQRKCQCNT